MRAYLVVVVFSRGNRGCITWLFFCIAVCRFLVGAFLITFVFFAKYPRIFIFSLLLLFFFIRIR